MTDIQERLETFSNIDPANLLSGGISQLIWIAFYILLFIFIIYTLALIYHWLRHGATFPPIWIFMITYGVVSFGLINAMFFSALSL